MTGRPPTSHNVPADDGCLQLIIGPMFSGKTTELIRRIRRLHIANYRCLLVKYAKDTRYSEDAVATHDSVTFRAIAATKLGDIVDELQQADVIGIDEGQFFPDVRLVAEKLASSGKQVIVAALDGDYRQEGFEQIVQLLPLAEFVNKLHAVCMLCYKDASFTRRMTNETAREVIGGSDKYIATCRKCHSAPLTNMSQPNSAVKMCNVSPYKDLPYTVDDKTAVPSRNLFSDDGAENSNLSATDSEVKRVFEEASSPKRARQDPLLQKSN